MVVQELFPEELPIESLRGLEAVHTIWPATLSRRSAPPWEFGEFDRKGTTTKFKSPFVGYVSNYILDGIEVSGVEFRGAEFWCTSLLGATFRECIFQSCGFEQVNCDRAQFIDCEFMDCSLSLSLVQGMLSDCEFDSCSIAGTRIDGSRLNSVSFDSCEFRSLSQESCEFLNVRVDAVVTERLRESR